MAATLIDANDEKMKARFWSKVQRSGADECWPWIGQRTKRGYGKFGIGRWHHVATHVSLVLDGRPRQGHLYALHRCDNPICVNPAHLWWGDQLENMRDCVGKGRMTPRRKGSSHPASKLSDSDAREIMAGTLSLAATARLYGVSDGTVSHIRKGRSWRHLFNHDGNPGV